MKIIVCIKQVPETTKIEVDPMTGVLKRDGVNSKINPYDLYALETALTLTSKHGGEVKVISMGPPQAEVAIKEAVYMGADSGVLVNDRRFAGADVLVTSYTISQALALMKDYDLIICGKQTTDGDTAQVGAEIAEFLTLPHASNVIAVDEVSDDRIILWLNLEHSFVKQSMPLPCLICVDGDINTPRLPSYKRKRSLADTKNILRFVSLDDLEDKNPDHYGLSGSPTQVECIFPPEKNAQKIMLAGDNKQMAEQLAKLLHQSKFI